MIQIKRAYEPPEPGDGRRILVDRLWPRGLTKAKARIDDWQKDLAPSNELRKWFGHDPGRWGKFRRKFRDELLSGHQDELNVLAREGRKKKVTLVYGAKDETHNQAVVLQELLQKKGRF